MITTYTFLSLRWMKQHWFKIALLVVFLLVLWKKEVSFGIHFNTPTSAQEPVQSQQVKHTTKKKFYTEDTKAAQEQGSLSNTFEQIRLFKKRKPVPNWENLDKQAVDAYLERFAKVAQVESRKFGIPASIILASGLVCSQAGQANYAQAGNNHFRLLCSEDWNGQTQQQEGKCLRAYDKAWSSYRDFSFYLTTGKQVGLLALEKQDYRSWAKALERLNNYSEINLSKQLIGLIEEFHLQQLDTE